MSLIDRATKSATAVADETVATVSQIGTALAEGVVTTANDVRTGLDNGRIRPRTMAVAAAVGLVVVVEWPLLVVAGGGALVYSKLRKRSTDISH